MVKNLTILFMLVIFIAIANVGWAETSFEVTGIMGGNPPIAIVNGQVVQKGGKIGGAEIIDISNDSVTLKYKNQVIVKSPGGQDIKSKNMQKETTHAYQVRERNSAIVDKQIEESIDSEYKRQQDIDAKWAAKEEAEKERRQELKLEEIDAKAYVDAAQGRLYDAKTDGYQRATFRLEQQDDDRAQEDSD